MHTREVSIFVDVLCILAADPTNGAEELNNHFLFYIANTLKKSGIPIPTVTRNEVSVITDEPVKEAPSKPGVKSSDATIQNLFNELTLNKPTLKPLTIMQAREKHYQALLLQLKYTLAIKKRELLKNHLRNKILPELQHKLHHKHQQKRREELDTRLMQEVSEGKIKSYKLLDFDLNTRDAKKRKAVEAAATSGSVASLHYLIETQNADISANDETRNLLEFSINNPPVLNYLLDPKQKRWQRFKDSTTDFLAHVTARRVEQIKKLFTENNHVICDSNYRNQNAFYWAHITKSQAIKDLVFELGKNYETANLLNKNWSNLGNYYACMGHYHALTRDNTELALLAFEKSIIFYSEAKLFNQLADVQLHCGNLLAKDAKKFTGKAAVLAYEKSIGFYKQALSNFQNRQKKLPFQDKKIDNLLRNLALCYNALDNFHMTQADGWLANQEYENVRAGYQKAVECGEKALAYLNMITNKISVDKKSLTDYENKLVLTNGMLSQMNAELAKGKALDEKTIACLNDLSEKFQQRKNCFLPPDENETAKATPAAAGKKEITITPPVTLTQETKPHSFLLAVHMLSITFFRKVQSYRSNHKPLNGNTSPKKRKGHPNGRNSFSSFPTTTTSRIVPIDENGSRFSIKRGNSGGNQ